MPFDIDPETINVDNLPGIWSPVQWELSEEERQLELEAQATASLLWSIDIPQAILRLLLSETAITRAYKPPEGYEPEIQGNWDENLLTFQFERPIHLINVEREHDSLYAEYKVDDLGTWAIEIETGEAHIYRL